jgi:hypothetical protein
MDQSVNLRTGGERAVRQQAVEIDGQLFGEGERT